METTLVFDYIENIEGFTPKKVYHIEDFIETHPEDLDKITAIYSLFKAEVEGEEKLYIQTATSSANIILPAAEGMLKEIFPDYAQVE